MLTPQEEQALRQLLKDSTPTPKPPVTLGFKAKEDNLVDRQLKKLPKMPVINQNDDYEIISRVRHTMLPDEKLLEWYSRTGLGRSQILGMTKDEISAFVAQADLNRLDDIQEPRSSIRLTTPPKHGPSVTLVG